jgi:hypothetical protein
MVIFLTVAVVILGAGLVFALVWVESLNHEADALLAVVVSHGDQLREWGERALAFEREQSRWRELPAAPAAPDREGRAPC